MKYKIFGESHGPAIGVVISNIPAGIELDFDYINSEMKRRAPGKDKLSTSRKEADMPEIISGYFEGKTTGAPLCAIIKNSDTHSSDYSDIKHMPRPSHSDYAAWVKYKGFNDYRGGGHFSGRLTAPLVFAGSIAKQYLKLKNIEISSEVSSLGGVENPSTEDINTVVLEAKNRGDSVGGTIKCSITGIKAGYGGPDYGDNVEGEIARAMFSVPAVKGIEFGAGFNLANMYGSEANDQFVIKNGAVETTSNNSGGVNGGITNGMPIVFKVVLRPTPSIAIEQNTIDIDCFEDTKLAIKGRHDPCVVLRALPVIEAASALAITEILNKE